LKEKILYKKLKPFFKLIFYL